MKCDELKRKYSDITGSYYGYNEVNEAIAELKAKVKFCSDFELAARKDIQEMRGQHQMLKQFGHYNLSPVLGKMINHEVRQYVSYNVVCMIITHLESENAQLKQKLEDVQASMYADVVDANMENRRLKRALWLARATIAHSTKYKYHRLSCKAEIDPQPHGWSCYINGEVYRTGKMNRELEPYYWIELWEEVERKCLKKAEEYK
ncbi:MAG: hypothetical protein J6T54_12330 [Fibrobacter sp.]|nr:hypothetical protein [Fibrobacter sp.]